VITALRSK